MKSLALMSLAVLIGVATCMSLQEFEDDELNTSDLGWFHVHFHFLDEANNKPKATCTGNTCRLCNEHDLKADVNGQKIELKFNGCIVVKALKKPERYQITFAESGKKVFMNEYSVNSKTILACAEKKADQNIDEALMCPVLFNTDPGKGKFCAKIVEKIKAGNTYMEHTIELGCTQFK